MSAAVTVTVSAVAGQTFRQPAAAANASYGLSPVIADVNGDGIPDFALTGTDQVGVLVYLGNGDGTFQTPQTYLPSTEIYKIAFADMNGDGLPDMIVAENSQIVILPGTGGGAFGAPQPIPNQISSAFRPTMVSKPCSRMDWLFNSGRNLDVPPLWSRFVSGGAAG